MTGITPVEGDQALLQAAVGLVDFSSALSLIVFDNNIGPSKSAVYADFHQPADPLYLPVPLNPGSWVLNTDASGATGAYPPVFFTFLGATTLYGAALVAGVGASSFVLLAFNFDSPIVIPAIGGTAGVTVTQFNAH